MAGFRALLSARWLAGKLVLLALFCQDKLPAPGELKPILFGTMLNNQDPFPDQQVSAANDLRSMQGTGNVVGRT
jgi:hypothetical protein